jgi:hypothetical protein
MSAKADLERGLTKEVKQMSEPLTGLKIDHRGSLDVGQPSPAAEVVLKKTASQLHCCRGIESCKRNSADAEEANWPAVELTTPATGGRRQA